MTTILVHEHNGTFHLRTDRDAPVGNRLWRGDVKGATSPPEETVFSTKHEADRAAWLWNMYLIAIQKQKRKSGESRFAD